MIFNAARTSGCAGIETMHITVAPRRFTSYIYLLRLVMAISHSFTFRLGFSSLLLLLITMEDKGGSKCPRSPSKEGSSSSSSVLTLPSAPSGSSLPPGSPSEVSSHRHCSPVFEQGGPSKKIPVVDLSSSSDEENIIPDTSWDAEFIKRLFGDLNCGLLGPPGDGKIIIISDSDEEEEEMHEEQAADAEAVSSSAVKSPAQPPPSLTPMTSIKGYQMTVASLIGQ
jgi:hypothetical protein